MSVSQLHATLVGGNFLQNPQDYWSSVNVSARNVVGSETENNTVGYSDSMFEDPFSDPWFKCAFILLYTVVFFICCFGNSVVLYTIAFNKRMRTRTNFFLANLAVADLGVGVVCILPKLIQYLSSRWLLGEAMCKISYFAQNMTYTASILLLTVISIERYIAVLHPLRSKCIVTETRLIISQVFIWVLSAAYNSPDLQMFTVFEAEIANGNGTVSFCLPTHPYTNMKNYCIINFFVWYILPLGVMIFMYSKVCYTLWQTGKLRCHNSQNAILLRPVSRRESTPTRQETVLCYDGLVAGVHTRKLGRSNNFIKESPGQNNNDNPTTLTSISSLRGGPPERPGPECSSYFDTNHVFESTTQRAETTGPGTTTRSHQHPHRPRRYLSCDYTSEGDATSSEDCDRGGGNNSPATPGARRAKCPYMMHSQRVMSSRLRVIKLLMVVMATFAVCVLPTHLSLLLLYWEIYPTPETRYDVLSPLSYVMLYGNSALNPILYWIFSDMFKRSFIKGCCCCRENSAQTFSSRNPN